jgi:hypothetical protein
MDFHDPQIDVAVMVLGAVIMAFALLRFRVLSETVPASDLRKFLILFGLGSVLTLAGGLTAFSR